MTDNDVLPRWIVDKCIDCAHASYSKQGTGCAEGQRIGVMLECEFYTPDKQRAEIMMRTKEILRNPK